VTEAAHDGCGYSFSSADAPRPTCGLDVETRCDEEPRHCYWHCSCTDVVEEKRTQSGVGERLAEAVQEQAHLEGAQLWGADLRGADLWAARLQDAMLMDAQLQGARLTDAQLQGASLYRAGIDRATECENSIWGTPREEIEGHWEQAAAIFHSLREHYRESGNERRTEEYYIREMRCLHLAQHGLGRRMVWHLHRVLWGYGAIPWLLLAWMVALVLAFGLVIFPVIGVTDSTSISHSVVDGLALSLVTFPTLGYGNRHPASRMGEMLGGLEGLLSMILVAMFVVSLTRKYVRG
jgi:hypothetical protein